MKLFTHCAVALALAGGLLAAPLHAQDYSDGIPVKPMSRLRNLQDERAVDQQSRQQYLALLNEAEQKQALVPASHPQVIRLRAIAKRLIPFAPRWNPAAAQWSWQVNLLNSSQVNAFCMPGGRIAFYSGILTKLNLSDDEVAIVMGHEIGHALREHGREQAAKTDLTNLASRIAGAGLAAWLGVDPNVTGAVTNTAAKLAVLSYSRTDESEADLVGLDLAARAGFDPRAGIALWEKMSAVSQGQPLEFLSTHPNGGSRIEEMNRNMGLVLPVYARARGLNPDALPAYRSTPLGNR